MKRLSAYFPTIAIAFGSISFLFSARAAPEPPKPEERILFTSAEVPAIECSRPIVLSDPGTVPLWNMAIVFSRDPAAGAAAPAAGGGLGGSVAPGPAADESNSEYRAWVERQTNSFREMATGRYREYTGVESATPRFDEVRYNSSQFDQLPDLLETGYQLLARWDGQPGGTAAWIKVLRRETLPLESTVATGVAQVVFQFDPEIGSDGTISLNARAEATISPGEPPAGIDAARFTAARDAARQRALNQANQRVAQINARRPPVTQEVRQAIKEGRTGSMSLRFPHAGEDRVIELKISGRVVRQINQPLGEKGTEKGAEDAEALTRESIAGFYKLWLEGADGKRHPGFFGIGPGRWDQVLAIDFSDRTDVVGANQLMLSFEGETLRGRARFSAPSRTVGTITLSRDRDGQLAGSFSDGAAARRISLEPLRPVVNEVSVKGISNGAVDYRKMSDLWRVSTLSNDNYPHIEVLLHGVDLPRSNRSDRAIPMNGMLGQPMCEFLDRHLGYVDAHADSKGTQLEIKCRLYRRTLPGTKRLLINGVPIDFELEFENYDGPSTVPIDLGFSLAEDLDRRRLEFVPSDAPLVLTAAFIEAPGPDRVTAGISVKRFNRVVHEYGEPVTWLTRSSADPKLYESAPFLLRGSGSGAAAPRIELGDKLTGELEGRQTIAEVGSRALFVRPEIRVVELRPNGEFVEVAYDGVAPPGSDGVAPPKVTQGKTFFVEARYTSEQAPGEDTTSATIRWAGGERTVVLQRVPERWDRPAGTGRIRTPVIFRSRPLGTPREKPVDDPGNQNK